MSVLQKYKNRPKFYFSLPSKNYFYNLSQEDMSILNEVGVMPLNVLHQLSLKNPEKLYNGSAIEEIITDCTTIKTIPPRSLLKCDVDFLLMGIKIATTGDVDRVLCQCPHCGDEHSQEINLEKLISTAKTHEPTYYVDISIGLSESREYEEKLRIYIKPSTFDDALKLEQEVFEDKKAISKIYKSIEGMGEEDITDEMQNEIYGSINKILTNLTVDTVAIYTGSILRIVVLDKDGNETVEQESDKEAIYEFLMSIGVNEQKVIKDKLTEINSYGVDKVVKLVCQDESCGKEYSYVYEVNMTDFFGEDS